VTNLTARTASLTVGSGVNIVTYTNAIAVSAQDGYIEICKYAEDDWISNTARFSFTITDAAGINYGPYSVLLNQCTPAIQVTSGPATITEAAQYPFFLDYVDVYPSNNWISQNLINGTVNVNVAASTSPTDETEVSFVNETELGFIKVCKALDSANSDALAGTTFYFPWTAALSTGGTLTGTAYVTANTFEQGPACAFIYYGEGLPLGSVVTISEEATLNVDASPSAPVNVTVPGTWNPDGNPGSNITSTTFTNQAEGTIEICKNAADTETLGNGHNPFQFVVNGSIDVTVNAGQCSNAINVPAGTATINELPSANFHFVSVTATGPSLNNVIVSGPTTSASGTSVTVSVPFSGEYLDGNETLVTYTNAVNTGVFKICKTSSSSSLSGSGFTFNWSYTLNGTTVTGAVTLEPGQCGFVNGSLNGTSGPIPVVDNTGTAVTVYVTGDTDTGRYVLNTDYYISGITFVGPGSLTSANTYTGASSFTIGQGTNALTYDNEQCNESGCPAPVGNTSTR
jgi:hypothetical protein